MSIWHEASRRLRGKRRSAAVLGAARYLTGILGLLAGSILQRILLQGDSFFGLPNRWDIFLPAAVIAALLALTPLRLQTALALGEISGILDENDLGFLAQTAKFRLWGKAILLRLLIGAALIFSACPALMLWILTKAVWELIPVSEEGLLPLLAVLHGLILTAAACFLPLRVYAAEKALPFCCLKLPHEPPLRVIRCAFRLSAGQMFAVLRTRICAIPALLLPFSAVYALPVLLTAELLRSAGRWRAMQPPRRTQFAQMELHAQ